LTQGIPIPGYSSLKIGLPRRGMLLQQWSVHRPDLVHIVTEGPLGWSALEAAQKLGIPICSDFRTNFDAYSSHYGLSWLKSPIQKYMRYFHNRTNFTMVPTQGLKNQLQSAGFERLRVLARGIDTDLFNEIIKDYYLTPENDKIPINSGMISLVYKMRTIDNEVVVVKMKRKNIDEKLDDAIEKLLFFIKLLSFIPQFNTLDIPNVIKKNINLLRQQLDFGEEVKNTKEMAENCKNLKYIKIPKVHEYATKEYPSIIIMDYIKGVHISKLDERDYDEYAKLVLKYGFVSIINDSVTHGDLHAGNIMIDRTTGNPVFIDFGRSCVSSEGDAYIEEPVPNVKMHFIHDEQMFRDKVKIPLGQYIAKN
jgi:hypothetical protein